MGYSFNTNSPLAKLGQHSAFHIHQPKHQRVPCLYQLKAEQLDAMTRMNNGMLTQQRQNEFSSRFLWYKDNCSSASTAPWNTDISNRLASPTNNTPLQPYFFIQHKYNRNGQTYMLYCEGWVREGVSTHVSTWHSYQLVLDQKMDLAAGIR